jgi:hypothetical protein
MRASSCSTFPFTSAHSRSSGRRTPVHGLEADHAARAHGSEELARHGGEPVGLKRRRLQQPREHAVGQELGILGE